MQNKRLRPKGADTDDGQRKIYACVVVSMFCA